MQPTASARSAPSPRRPTTTSPPVSQTPRCAVDSRRRRSASSRCASCSRSCPTSSSLRRPVRTRRWCARTCSHRGRPSRRSPRSRCCARPMRCCRPSSSSRISRSSASISRPPARVFRRSSARTAPRSNPGTAPCVSCRSPPLARTVARSHSSSTAGPSIPHRCCVCWATGGVSSRTTRSSSRAG